MHKILTLSAVIATRNRAAVLGRTLDSLARQSAVPSEIVVVDASQDSSTRQVVEEFSARMASTECHVLWKAAQIRGAATQRNEGMAIATKEMILFIDDDILFEDDCLSRMHDAMSADPALGGVSALIVNQTFSQPGPVGRLMYTLMAGRAEPSYAGRVLGPAVNIWPENREGLPDVVPVDWLYTTCVMYRRTFMPDPAFDHFFTGYSIGEDLTISLRVGKRSRLANIPRARIFHDTQPGDHKADPVALSRMHLVNRHYIMSEVLNRTSFRDYARLVLWELFQFAASAVQTRLGGTFWRSFYGRLLGAGDIVRGRANTKTKDVLHLVGQNEVRG